MKDSLTIEPSRAGHVAQGRDELRDEQLFARLIGAAVLLALAVIILPFVLDGSGSQRQYEYAETLPPEPSRAPEVESSFSSRPGANKVRAATETETTATGTASVVPQAAPARSEVQASIPPITPTLDLQPSRATNNRVRTTSELTSDVASAADGGRIAGQIGGNQVQSSGLNDVPLKTGWNIQVASFVRDANAIKLLNRLRDQNLPAYANTVQGRQRTLIRVLVGPYGNQIDALALQNSINRDYRVESLIVRGR